MSVTCTARGHVTIRRDSGRAAGPEAFAENTAAGRPVVAGAEETSGPPPRRAAPFRRGKRCSAPAPRSVAVLAHCRVPPREGPQGRRRGRVVHIAAMGRAVLQAYSGRGCGPQLLLC